MNFIPTISSYEDRAIDTVISVINKAKEKLGDRQNLGELAHSRNILENHEKVSLRKLKDPLVGTTGELLRETIERKWFLTETFEYVLNYLGTSQDECSQYYYFEGIFSQPTATYPIPQATVSVFFRVEDKHIEPLEFKGVPKLVFRIEGTYTDHDVRFVRLTADWILAVLKMKIKLFQRIENILLF